MNRSGTFLTSFNNKSSQVASMSSGSPMIRYPLINIIHSLFAVFYYIIVTDINYYIFHMVTDSLSYTKILNIRLNSDINLTK